MWDFILLALMCEIWRMYWNIFTFVSVSSTFLPKDYIIILLTTISTTRIGDQGTWWRNLEHESWRQAQTLHSRTSKFFSSSRLLKAFDWLFSESFSFLWGPPQMIFVREKRFKVNFWISFNKKISVWVESMFQKSFCAFTIMICIVSGGRKQLWEVN